MERKINMFLATEAEYRRGLAHKLLNEGVIDFCLAAVNPYTHLPEKDDRIVTVNTLPSMDDEYYTVCDINELPALSTDLMERMRPFESMALKMGDRRAFCRPISEYADEKRKYLQHLRYWNYMLDKYNINLVVHACPPHSPGMVVLDSLAHVKGIPSLIWFRNGLFVNRLVWGDSINSIGNSIEERYNKLTEERIDDFELDDDIERDYQRFLSDTHETLNNTRKIKSKRSLIRNNRIAYRSKFKYFMREYIRYNIRAIVKPETSHDLRDREVWFRLRKKQLKSFKYYIRNQIAYAPDYDKMAVYPDYSKKYICFYLQAYPEATTAPMGGVFAEQYTSIQLLARAAEKVGCLVYVREHPAQTDRPHDVYSEIKDIKNVVFIKTTVKSSDVIKNSVAVATQTGSCIIEAALLGKPAIVFGKGHIYKGCPNVYEMTDEDQGAKIIQSLIDGFTLNKADIRRYMYAVQLETLLECDIEQELKRVLDYNYVEPEVPLDDRVKLIKKFIGDKLGNEEH